MELASKWYAVRVRSRHEKQTAKDLQSRGYEVCQACAPQRRVWADRTRVVDMPLFPGYIFACFAPSSGSDILRAAGVVSIIGFGGHYCPVEDAEIEAIRIVMASGVEVQREPMMIPGRRVRVCQGPLRGLEGVLDKIKSQQRLVVSLSLLQRSVTVEVSDFMLEPMAAHQSTGDCAAA